MTADDQAIIDELRQRLTRDWRQDALLLQQGVEAHLDRPALVRELGRMIERILPGAPRRQLVRVLCQDAQYCHCIMSGAEQALDAGDAVQALQDLEPLQEAEEVYLHGPAAAYFGFANVVELRYYETQRARGRTIRVPDFPFNRFYALYLRALRQLGGLPPCLGVTNRAIVRNPLYARMLVEQADIQRALGQMDAARGSLKRAQPLLYRAADLAHYFRAWAEIFAAADDMAGAACARYAQRRWQPDPDAPDAAVDAQAEYADSWEADLQDRGVACAPNLVWAEVAGQLAEQAWETGDYSAAGLGWTVRLELTADETLADRIDACRQQGGRWD